MKETLMALAQKIEEERQVIANDIGMGRATEFAQYQHSCGIIRGFLVVQGIIAEELRRIKEDDDE